MRCACGRSFDINPLEKDALKTAGATPGPDEVKTRAMNLIDSKINRNLILLVTCTCGSTRFKMIHYSELLELPDPEVSDDFYTKDGNRSERAKGKVIIRRESG